MSTGIGTTESKFSSTCSRCGKVEEGIDTFIHYYNICQDCKIIIGSPIKIEIPGGRIEYLTVDELVEAYIRLIELEDRVKKSE